MTLANEVWVLVGDKVGDDNQAVELARALNCKYRIIRVRYNLGYHLPNSVLGTATWTVSEGLSEILPPWPKIVIGTGRRSVPLCRFIKKASGGAGRIVRIGRPRVNLSHLDLVITTPQYRLPQAWNVCHLALPIANSGGGLRPNASIVDGRRGRLTEIVVLIGGDSDLYRFDKESALDLASKLSALATREQRRVWVCYGRRVKDYAAEALDEALGECLAKSHRYKDPGKNPYASLLDSGDLFVITTDSASMMGDVIRRGQPVFLYSAKYRPNLIYTMRMYLDSLMERLLKPARWARWVAFGVYVPVKRMDIMVREILSNDGVARLGEPTPEAPAVPSSVPFAEIVLKLKVWLN